MCCCCSHTCGTAHFLCGERLSTLKSTGRGRGVRGQVAQLAQQHDDRAEIWHILRYQCHLLGIHFRSETPDGTSHTCPHCGILPAHLPLASSTAPPRAGEVGTLAGVCPLWLHADRDYCAALNIARLGIASVTSMYKRTGSAKAFSVTDDCLGQAVSLHGTRRGIAVSAAQQIPIASWKEASSTSMAGRKPSPCVRRMSSRCSYDCVAERAALSLACCRKRKRL